MKQPIFVLIFGLSGALCVIFLVFWASSYFRSWALCGWKNGNDDFELRIAHGKLIEYQWPGVRSIQATASIQGVPLRTIPLLPVWLGFALIGVSMYMTAWMHALLQQRRIGQGFCPTCSYDLTGNTSGTCPECGTTIPAADDGEDIGALKGIRRGLEDVKRGRTLPARQALDEIRVTRNIPHNSAPVTKPGAERSEAPDPGAQAR